MPLRQDVSLLGPRADTRRNYCAVYTRKSSNEGLDSAFNSLDAQREACTAYIASQAGEGWEVFETTYDDGGFSGGNTERPALQRLLEDIARGRVNTVVVYKIDRLTRSLADFAKLVELFDKNGVKFVSVTQSFNTTTSMGRLTLNTLLSFAQFEREISSERIRDKKEAASKKGMFVGGCAMLGYDLRDKKLVVNKEEAARVRHMFDRYLVLRSTGKLLAELNASGQRPKQYVRRDGSSRSSQTWYSSNLVQMLRNRRYVGEVKWGDRHYPGQHDAIVPTETFEKVQQLLDQTIIPKPRSYRAKLTRLLSGLLFDDLGIRMIFRLAGAKDPRQWGYYISYSRLHKHKELASLTSVRSSRIEPIVMGVVTTLATRMGYRLPVQSSQRAARTGPLLERGIGLDDLSADRRLLAALVERVTLCCDRVEIDFVLPDGCTPPGCKPGDGFSIEERNGLWRATVVVSLGTGSAFRSIDFPEETPWRTAKPRFNRQLLKALHSAHVARSALQSGKPFKISELANEAGVHRRNYYRLMQLAYLAPDIQEMILTGRQPRSVCVDTFLNNQLPLIWSEQRQLLGLDGRCSANGAPELRRRDPRKRKSRKRNEARDS